MRHLLSVLLEATGHNGRIGFVINGAQAWRACIDCGMKFEQTDEAWERQKTHEFDAHERPMHFNWRDLHGKTVTIACVEREDTDYRGQARIDQELMARDEDGVYYLLPRPSDGFGGTNEGWKWKPQSAESNLLKLMQPAQASPSNG